MNKKKVYRRNILLLDIYRLIHDLNFKSKSRLVHICIESFTDALKMIIVTRTFHDRDIFYKTGRIKS